jgi:hypothetical protein
VVATFSVRYALDFAPPTQRPVGVSASTAFDDVAPVRVASAAHDSTRPLQAKQVPSDLKSGHPRRSRAARHRHQVIDCDGGERVDQRTAVPERPEADGRHRSCGADRHAVRRPRLREVGRRPQHLRGRAGVRGGADDLKSDDLRVRGGRGVRTEPAPAQYQASPKRSPRGIRKRPWVRGAPTPWAPTPFVVVRNSLPRCATGREEGAQKHAELTCPTFRRSSVSFPSRLTWTKTRSSTMGEQDATICSATTS